MRCSRNRLTGYDQALYSSQTPTSWTGKPTAAQRAVQAGIERVPIRSVGLHRLQENPKECLDGVSGSFVSRSALPSPGRGKLGLQRYLQQACALDQDREDPQVWACRYCVAQEVAQGCAATGRILVLCDGKNVRGIPGARSWTDS